MAVLDGLSGEAWSHDWAQYRGFLAEVGGAAQDVGAAVDGLSQGNDVNVQGMC